MANLADKTAHRPQRRYVFPAGAPVAVHLPDPHSDASPSLQPLLDLSATGLSFAFDPGGRSLTAGDTLEGVVVCVGRHRIAGSLRVVHVRPARFEGAVCGAVFRPASDRADAALRAVLAWLDALDSRPVPHEGSPDRG